MDSAFNYWTNIVFKQVFRKVLYWAFYFLIFLSMICCFSQQNMNSVILLMTTAFILVEFREHIHWPYLKCVKRILMVCMQFNQSKSCQISIYYPRKHRLTYIANRWYITKKSVSSVTLLGITINSKLNFKEYINNIMKRGYYKLYALRRLRKFLT